MPGTTFDFAANVKSAVDGVRKMEGALESLKGEATSVSGALQNVATAHDKLGPAGAGAAAGVQIARTSIQGMMAAANVAGDVLGVLSKAFSDARAAAELYGDVKVAEQIDGMYESIERVTGVLLELPVFGKGVLDWMGDAAEGATNLANLVGVLEIQFKQFTGEINATEAATLAGKLVNDEYNKSLVAMYDSAAQAKKALEEMQKASVAQGGSAAIGRVVRKGTGASERWVIIDAQGNEVPMPGRAIGGPVTAGQPVVVGERGPEVFVPPVNGRIAPNVAGGASGGGGMVVSQTVAVTVAAGAFLGSRSDANKLGQQLAPIVGRAQRQSASGGLRR